ncbi:PHB depolymerase family esterase [Sphingobium sp. 3R8]|uniref:extracellular catalytic domain type 1 short-chain-length polyhydroxyalkanoate depolymerase n=1 Tax=Sphingobium sp. 3R8 TaxID=2874921 RepID=UPI001CCE2ECD|nr:PHB depolymerase family esterase [Sphingobium sp. 3R8]MBZ9648488.1 PHB depolymerase family esterase [Sphingobium sp. 3R8]
MAHLGKTIAQLAQLRSKNLPNMMPGRQDRLTDLTDFGSNPGALRARIYVPEHLARNPALVVVLHGCTQDAAGYDHGSGWSHVADAHGFALLFPEQTRANNPNLCFNWFSSADARRDGGEASSIRHMVAAMTAQHDIDPSRVFVTGLSAGGAMASIMLAAYPEVFAGGAIIAGLPFGAAHSISDAFARMRGAGYPADARLATLVRDASGHDGLWPTVSVWQGSADKTVDPSNAERTVAQWRGIHGVADGPGTRDIVDGCARECWIDPTGRRVIESYTITGMGHGTPIQTNGPDACGVSGPYMLDASISSTRHMARAWGLLQAEQPTRRQKQGAQAAPEPARAKAGVGAIIEDALRSAGLMR